MDQGKLNEILEAHAQWLRQEERGIRANLRGANLDYSCFPLWCGGTKFKADDRLVRQVLAHLCSLEVSGEMKAVLDRSKDEAKKSHRAYECGLIEEED